MTGNNSKLGFTLAEILVTVGIFAITVIISSGIFINVNNLQQQAASMERLQNEGRYVLEKIGKEIRGRELDYSQLVFSSTGLVDSLVFKKDEFGEVLELDFNKNSKSILFTLDGEMGRNSAQLNSSDVLVDKALFLVNPQDDPYSLFSTSTPFAQPRVTILLSLKNKNMPERYQRSLDLQTTFSSKVYR